jgi:endonuclease III
MRDYYSIDISVDVHVRRVFAKLGMVPLDAKADQLIYRARAINPEFPGILDLPLWEVGRNWCMPKKPKCSECYLSEACPHVGV